MIFRSCAAIIIIIVALFPINIIVVFEVIIIAVVKIIVQPRIGEIFERLVERQVNANPDPLTAEFLKFKDDLALFQSLSDPRGVYARLLFNLRID